MKKQKPIVASPSQRKISNFFSKQPAFSKLQLKRADRSTVESDKSSDIVQKIADDNSSIDVGGRNFKSNSRKAVLDDLDANDPRLDVVAVVVASPSKKPKTFDDVANEKRSFDSGILSLHTCDDKENSPGECFNDAIDEFDDLDEYDFTQLDMDIEDLNLNTWQKCEVTDVKIEANFSTLKLNSLGDNCKGTCVLKDFWKDVQLEKGNIVSIIAHTLESNKYCISNEGGFLVLWPDNLITGTEIVGSLFCMRKSILQSVFRGIEPTNKIMVTGTLVHELLQMCLASSCCEIKDITAKCDQMLHKDEFVQTLYDCGMGFEDAMSEMNKFIPNISNFMKKYIKSCKTYNTPSKQSKTAWDGQIEEIIDIEENIWSPKLGISGRIDVTVGVKIHNKQSNGSTRILMPLELKTGRATSSPEHRGQVILYTMIMSVVGKQFNGKLQDISKGLLLYLRESVELQLVTANYTEKRDLIILRNQLAYYLEKWKTGWKYENETIDNIILPKPINHHNACKSCSYLTLCSIFLSKYPETEISESHLLMKLKESVLGHLNVKDIEYFMHWCMLINIEETEKVDMIDKKDIWNIPAVEREKRGKCLNDLVISSIKSIDNKKEHTFIRRKDNKIENFIFSQLHSGSYVIISTEHKYAETSGFVTDISSKEIKVLLNKDLSKRNSKGVLYTIDAYDSSINLVYNLTNLGILMDNTEISHNLRRIIIHKEYSPSKEKISKTLIRNNDYIFKRLNTDQMRAILTSLTAKDFLLVNGMPGTGKTQTLVNLIELLVNLKKSVLITSHTHSAVDNIFIRLKKCNIKMLRLGSDNRIHKDITKYSEQTITRNCKTPESLEAVYNSVDVVGVTCLGSNHSLLSKRVFDVCIVDESSQVLQCSLLRPLYSAKKFILFGDPDQLAPVIKSSKARTLGMDESLFERLNSIGATISLTLQYRMNKAIMELANRLTYDNQLKCANENVENSTIAVSEETAMDKFKSNKWLLPCVSSSIENSVIMIDTGPTHAHCAIYNKTNMEKSKDYKYSNICEASLIFLIIKSLFHLGIKPQSIGIIAPFNDQVFLLKQLAGKLGSKSDESNYSDVEISTVDQYQGRDKDIILYSCSKSEDVSHLKTSKEHHLLENKRRLTVAITRAKCKLIMIGDVSTLCCFKPFQLLFECISKDSATGKRISIPELESSGDFLWRNMLNIFE